MLCGVCAVDKLANEFPPENVTDDCSHPGFACLRCTIRIVGEKSTCPYPECGLSATLSDKKLKWFKSILDHMFREYIAEDIPENVPQISGTATITVTVITGECMHAVYNPSLTIQQLKGLIQKTLHHEPAKQKLLFNEKELSDYLSDGRQARLSDYNIKPNSMLMLVVLMFAIPDQFDNVVFDLFWGYPIGKRDYLDASCLLFQGQSFMSVVDYHNHPMSCIRHSGDVMDDQRRLGHHTINVHLKNIPSNVTHLFFTLSAYMSPNISKYPNPSLKFYEADKPNKDLCKTSFTHAGHSQAVIMCSVSRDVGGRWNIFESGKLSAGNVNNYNPLAATIQSLIRQGF